MAQLFFILPVPSFATLVTVMLGSTFPEKECAFQGQYVVLFIFESLMVQWNSLLEIIHSKQVHCAIPCDISWKMKASNNNCYRII